MLMKEKQNWCNAVVVQAPEPKQTFSYLHSQNELLVPFRPAAHGVNVPPGGD